jgi:hypothetical protein
MSVIILKIRNKMIITAINEIILNSLKLKINEIIQINTPYTTSNNLMDSSLFSASLNINFANAGRKTTGRNVKKILIFVK